MQWLWIVLVGASCLSASPTFAQLYRWTDEKGQTHITDDPATIPPKHRDRARSSARDEPAPAQRSDGAPQPPAVPQPPRLSPPPAPQSTPPLPAVQQDLMSQRLQELARDLAAARQERQTYLDQLRDTRRVHTTPEFVRYRRQLAEIGRALVAVEQRLDILATEFESLQTALQGQQLSPETQRALYTGVDAQGHDATYWRQRAQAILAPLQQAQQRRRELLTHMRTWLDDEWPLAPEQARALLQQTETLQQIEVHIEAARQAWQALRQEALRADAPLEWLQ